MKPVDCAQFLTAFARVEMFDFELFEFLELQLVKNLHEANGQTLVTVLLAHSALCQNVIKECFVQKIHKRRFWNLFKNFNEEFLCTIIKALTAHLPEINLRGVL